MKKIKFCWEHWKFGFCESCWYKEQHSSLQRTCVQLAQEVANLKISKNELEFFVVAQVEGFDGNLRFCDCSSEEPRIQSCGCGQHSIVLSPYKIGSRRVFHWKDQHWGAGCLWKAIMNGLELRKIED